jgi:hypothetical protein
VKRLLVDCDHVFEVLTRGPFPTGAADDAAVEHHLRACHDCRRLAEALRPAIELLHEAVADDEALALPEYQGALACDLPVRRRAMRLAGDIEAPPSEAVAVVTAGRRQMAPPNAHHAPRMLAAVRWIAASLLLASAGVLAGAMYVAPGLAPSVASLPRNAEQPAFDEPFMNGVPTAQSLMRLTALRLPLVCLPASHHPVSLADADVISAALASGTQEALRCCTECHHAGAASTASTRMIATTQESCRACHHG